jgi:hypothetical protein
MSQTGLTLARDCFYGAGQDLKSSDARRHAPQRWIRERAPQREEQEHCAGWP